MKPAIKSLLAVALLAAGVLGIRSDTFQRATNPSAYWAQQAEELSAELAADRVALRVGAINLERRQANLKWDLAEDAAMASGDSEHAKLLREATMEDYRADLKSLVSSIRFWRAEIARDDSALRYARHQLE